MSDCPSAMSAPGSLACDPTAIDASEREQHREVSSALFECITDLREVSDGYAFRLPSDPDVIRTAGAFVSRERLCCPFFRFSIEVSPDQGPVWLKMTGRDGVKGYVEEAVLPYWDLD